MMQAKIRNPIVELLCQLADATKAIWHRSISAGEVSGLGKQEAAGIARDLGISAEDLSALAGQDNNAADLLVRRMATVGLDPTKVGPTVMHDLQRCCSMCGSKQLCVHELEDKPRVAIWPKYCPNEYTLAALASENAMPNTPSAGSDHGEQSSLR